MTQEQRYLLESLSLKPFMLNEKQLNLLKDVLDKEIEMRNDIRSKEVKLELATKVENETGNDQHIKTLKQELLLARKNYAQVISEFDENKHVQGFVAYNQETGLPYGVEEDRLEPLDNHVEVNQSTPVWEVVEIQEDGTEKHLGYSGG